MTDLQTAVALMCVMGIAFAIFTKLLFDAFIVHFQHQSDLTIRAVEQAGDAVALNRQLLETLNSLLHQQQSTSTDNTVHALQIGRDAIMESFDHVEDKNDQMLADARLQEVSEAIDALAIPPHDAKGGAA
jgi:hypothetical protein